ncbi:DUF3800 domain-containing protein [Amycolatopsis sp. NPDC051106]|uniref:DUF3800 domain-containing protein n=1 Tax=unclassified Amycolatopsis TaxID=2618356 RepID=UPI0034204504
MRLVFIDDSQQREPPRRGLGHLMAMGAVIFPEEEVATYADTLAAIRIDLGIPSQEEIKWKAPKGSFLASAGGEVAGALRARMLEAAIDHQVRSIVVVIDHSASYTQRNQAEVGREILKWLFERVSMLLDDYDDIGIMIADKPGGGSAEEGRWLADTLCITGDGTEYVEPGKIVLPIVTAPSHHVPHLQLADLVVASTTAAIAGRKSGLDLAPKLVKIMHRHSLGDVNGAGLVIFPPKYNLYYQAFGETGCSKPGRNTGFVLPVKGHPYYDDDGLG